MVWIVVAFALFCLEILYFKIARCFGIVDRPSRRGSSSTVVLRGGGIIFPVAALLSFFLSGFSMPLFMLGLMVVSVLSFADDIHSLSPRLRLPVQFLGVLLMIAQLLLLSPDRPTALSAAVIAVAALVICTGAVNVFNFMDGINGIIGGYSLVVLAAVAAVLDGGSLFTAASPVPAVVPPSALPDLAFCTIIADLVFCFFNFRRRARCFAGDVGSVSIAFIVLFLLGYIMVATRDVSWLAFLVVFGVDGCLTIVHRLMLHDDISKPHRKHAYQLMANELHLSHVSISLFYALLQAACCAFYLLRPGYATLFVEIAVLSAAYILFMRKFYHLHVESGNA